MNERKKERKKEKNEKYEEREKTYMCKVNSSVL
jgi:hypothetical protein